MQLFLRPDDVLACTSDDVFPGIGVEPDAFPVLKRPHHACGIEGALLVRSVDDARHRELSCRSLPPVLEPANEAGQFPDRVHLSLRVKLLDCLQEVKGCGALRTADHGAAVQILLQRFSDQIRQDDVRFLILDLVHHRIVGVSRNGDERQRENEPREGRK